MPIDVDLLRQVVQRALDEDLGAEGDLTTRLCVPPEVRAKGWIEAREPGVLAGLDVVEHCFAAVDDAIELERHCQEGARVTPGQIVVSLVGPAVALLAGERTALNFLQRLSGIATMARTYVDAVGEAGVRIYDTRKTTPGLRALEKYAVAVGGGSNHRFGLFDQALLKENHFALAAPTSYVDVVRAAVRGSSAPVVAEARTLEEALHAVDGGAAVVMLDNFAPGDELRRAVSAVREAASAAGRSVEIEASGGIRLDNIRQFAACGIDRVSVGALTHSVRALDLSMLIEVER